MERITPKNLRNLRKKLGLSSQQAADSVYKNRRLWQRYEAPVTASSSLNIPPATLELFCLKHGLPYPPYINGNLGKAIGITGGTCPLESSVLAIELSTQLIEDGFDVLVVTSEFNYGNFNDEALAKNLPYPKVITFKEFPDNESKGEFNLSSLIRSGQDKLKQAIKSYDFTFFDISIGQAAMLYPDLEPEIILSPISVEESLYSIKQSILGISLLRDRLPKSKKIKFVTLMQNVNTDYAISLNQYGLNNDPEISSDFYRQAEKNKHKLTSVIEYFKSLSEEEIHFMNSYTSNIYREHLVNLDSALTVCHQDPNSLATHEVQGVKNEILRLLGVPERSY